MNHRVVLTVQKLSVSFGVVITMFYSYIQYLCSEKTYKNTSKT